MATSYKRIAASIDEGSSKPNIRESRQWWTVSYKGITVRGNSRERMEAGEHNREKTLTGEEDGETEQQ